MPAPMQISLEEIISMLLQRVEALSASDENSKTKQNIIYRALYKKGLITEEDILDSVKEEYRMLKELGELRTSGILTEEEFQEQKRRILS